jgi:CubicO group peptidase (beta-lactamase class C family)
VDEAALKKLVAQAFVGAGDPLAANTRGVAVVHKGKLLVAQTAPGFAPETALHGWSMAKTVTGMLAYKIAADNGLRINTPVVNAFPIGREPAWVAPWRNDTRKTIKVADLFYMRDGLANVEGYQPWDDVPRMLWGSTNVAAFSAAAPPEAPAGTRWRYASQTANLLAAVARAQLPTDGEYWAYPQRALFWQIGANSAVMETDASGNWVGSSYLWASVGDWARLGLLMLNDGHWDGRQVVPAGWLARAQAPSVSAGEGPGYGAMTWRYGDPQAGTCKGRGIPDDTLAMIGHWGQMVAMVPSRDTVIVRLGWTFKRGQFDGCALVADVLKTLPK